MKKINLMTGVIILFYFSSSVAQPSYKIPPSISSSASVPVISDQRMQACVEIYNHAEWLASEIKSEKIDIYSQESVDSYNALITKHSNLIDNFNRECAGKQSRSACEAAQKLNRENGLPESSC
ncbi:hypothetical protein MACH16_15850 [Marinomonas pontica]|uniref:Uncharacterized protein n=1 Tax=Marinomonas pontica TaxID=264739 RepID=A0ABN6WLT6_9GAMM|nr:hypothetical protein MACH16_15850 [Marinomonas pontica]